jgi:hypothetical protein
VKVTIPGLYLLPFCPFLALGHSLADLLLLVPTLLFVFDFDLVFFSY